MSPFQVVRNGWSRFTPHFYPLVLGHLVAVFLLALAFSACFVPYLLVFGSVWFGYAAMALQAARSKPVSLQDLFSGFSEGWFLNAMVIGVIFNAIPIAVQLVVLIPLDFMPSSTIGINNPFEQSAEDWQRLIVYFAVMSTIGTVAQIGTVVFLSPAMFILHDRKCAAMDAVVESMKSVWRDRKWWSKLWGWLGLIHLFGLFTCGLAWIVIHPFMAVTLAEAYEVKIRRRRAAGPPPIPR